MIVGYVSKQALALLFLFFGLTIAVIIKQLQKSFSFIPYTPTLFMISVALGYFADDLGVIGESINSISQMNPKGILLIFLPPLIFEGAFNSDWYIFRKQSYQIFILAFPSVFISALLLMISLKVIVGFDQSFYDWPQAFMFGSVLSCTDTVAVLALLKEAGAPKKFNSLIEGQSLLNDGTCMILLTISIQLCKGTSMHFFQIVVLFCQLTIGALVLGILFGMISTFLIYLTKKDSILTINVTIAMCYLLYFTAQYVYLGIRISGIMALVAMGLYMAAFGKTKFTPEARQKNHQFWKVFVFVAETIIFILGGVMVGTKALGHDLVVQFVGKDEIIKVLILYVCMIFARFFSIASFMPKLQVQGYGLKWTQVIALTYGGLRGAVGIAFTLILASNQHIPIKCRMICLFNMAGCSFLTLLINAPTCGLVIKNLGLCVKSQIKQKLFRKFLKECLNDLQKKVQELEESNHLKKSDWPQVKIKSGIQQLSKYIKEHQNRQSIQLTTIQRGTLDKHLLQDQINANVDQRLLKQIRNRFLIALKGIFWQKFQNNQCSGISIKNLIQCVDLDLDTLDLPLSSWQFLIGHIHNPAFFPVCFWLRKFPIIKHMAFSLIYERVMVIYDVVSTYIQGLKQCQNSCKLFPFQKDVINIIINQSKQNRKLAGSFLDKQIRIAYPQIMKRIQTAKAAHSLLTYEKQTLKEKYKHGQVDQLFYKQLNFQIDLVTEKVQNDSGAKEQLSDSQILSYNSFFSQMTVSEKNQILSQKIQLVFQKDQPVIKAYEKQKYIYLVTRGQISEQWVDQKQVIFKKNTKLYQLAGTSGLWNPNSKQLEYYCSAQSIVCLFCFPIASIKQIILKNSKLEDIIYKECLPVLLKLNPNLKIQITVQTWYKIKSFVLFKRLLKDQQLQLQGHNILLVEGQIKIDENLNGPGYYQKTKKKVQIIGPAKIFYTTLSFIEEELVDKMRQSERSQYEKEKRASRKSVHDTGAFRRTLYTRD